MLTGTAAAAVTTLRGNSDELTTHTKWDSLDEYQSSSNEPPPEATVTVPLHANDGTHHVYLYVGSPPQRQTLIVDTGSRLVAFPCNPCPDCGKHASAAYYDPEQSTTDVTNTCEECKFVGMSQCADWNEVKPNTAASTAVSDATAASEVTEATEATESSDRRLQAGNQQPPEEVCKFVQMYTEGSQLTAYEVTDLMWLGTDSASESRQSPFMTHAVPFVFGCQTSEKGMFRSQYADGIIGIAAHTKSLVTQMYEEGATERDMFALCLNKAGGTFSVGGTGLKYKPGDDDDNEVSDVSDGPHHLEPMSYTPLSKSHGWYSVGIEAIHVGDTLITTGLSVLNAFNDEKGAIIDSGTTDTYFPRLSAKPFRRAWEAITGRVYSNKLESYTYDEFQALPIITITLTAIGARNRDVIWEVHPANYMEPAKTKHNPSPMGMLAPPTSDGNAKSGVTPWSGTRTFTSRIYLDEPTGCVLGGNAMADHDILFDLENRKVGIAKADCTYRSSEYVPY